MITYDEKNQLFHIQTKNTSYCFGFYQGKFLMHYYWGKRLNGPFAVEDFYDFERSGGSMSTSDYEDQYASRDVLPGEFSTFGNTDLRTPAFHVQYPDGSRITELSYESHRIFAGKKPLEGLPATYVEDDSEATSLEVTLADSLTGLKVVLSYTAFEEADAITRSVRVENAGQDTVRLKSVLSALLDFKTADYDMVHLPGSWARERHIERQPLFSGKQIVDSVRGASSGQHNPFFALVSHGATEETGEAYGFSLVYSGNFTAGAEVDAFGKARAFIGINPFDFEYVLEAGMSFQSPEAVLVYSDSGLGKMSRIYHRLYRTRLCRGRFRDMERYVLINNWEATYFNFNEEKIVSIAEKASQVGVELLVLDDGWFGKRNDDTSSLGDWKVNLEKLPGGLNSLVEKVNALGMKFGLWFEPEMVSPDSDCYRAHEDWCIHVKDRIRSQGRHQLMLDLSREDVCEYVLESVSAVLNSADIEYVKWDCNRSMSNIGSAKLDARHQGEFCHRYILGLYRVLEELNRRFPNVLFESCSSGGARFDPGMLYYMPQTWCSDDSDAVERALIQCGTSLCYPYSSMGAHVSAVPNHQVGRVTPIAARGAVAMQGQFGYELDLNRLSDSDIEQVKEQIRFYKKYGEVFHKGDLYRLQLPQDGPVATNEFVSEDKNTVIVVRFVLKATPDPGPDFVRLCGLDEKAVYTEEGTGRQIGGDVLMNAGISLMPKADYMTQIRVFHKNA